MIMHSKAHTTQYNTWIIQEYVKRPQQFEWNVIIFLAKLCNFTNDRPSKVYKGKIYCKVNYSLVAI